MATQNPSQQRRKPWWKFTFFMFFFRYFFPSYCPLNHLFAKLLLDSAKWKCLSKKSSEKDLPNDKFFPRFPARPYKPFTVHTTSSIGVVEKGWFWNAFYWNILSFRDEKILIHNRKFSLGYNSLTEFSHFSLTRTLYLKYRLV